jgi:hypothetical protein
MICWGPPLGSPAFLLPLFTLVRGRGILRSSVPQATKMRRKKLAEPAQEDVYYHKLADHQEDD